MELDTIAAAPTGNAADAADAADAAKQAKQDDRARRGVALGRYLLLDRIGAGGMGVVYAAYDPELDRKVAVKILREEHTSPERQRRLTREAQAMARLSHPNVVAVHDVGVAAGAVFIAMDLVDGGNVAAWRTEARRSWRDVIHVFLAAGAGLAAAHRKGLVHRDFKPDNVLVRAADQQVLVSDFGLARLSEEATPTPGPADDGGAVAAAAAGALAQQLTRAGALLGTPAYMAPEQHRGEPADARSDQFAFCVALYEALYGERPFRGDPDPATGLESVDALALAIIDGKIQPAPAQADVPGWLRKVVVRGLAPAPGERWPSMDALLAELRRDPARTARRWLVAGVAVVAAGVAVAAVMRSDARAPVCTTASERVAAVWGPTVKAAAAAAFAATGKPFAAGAWQRTEHLLDDYADQWSAMHLAACEATEVRHEQSAQLLDERMACLDRRLGAFGALAALFTGRIDDALLTGAINAAAALPPIAGCADLAALTALVPLPDDPALRGRIRAATAALAKVDALDAAGKPKEALAAVEPIIAEARAIGYPVTLADALFARAHQLQTLSDFKVGEPATREALDAAGRAHEDEHTAMMIAALEYMWMCTGRNTEALALVPAADAMLHRAGDPPFATVALAGIHAQLLEAAGNYAEALTIQQAAIALQERVGPHEPVLGTLLMGLSDTLRQTGKLDEAHETIDRAIETLIAQVGPEHPLVVTAYGGRGDIEITAGDFAAASADYHRELDIAERAIGMHTDFTSAALMNVGLTDMVQHHFAEAEREFAQALALRIELTGPDSPDVARIEQNTALLYYNEGKWQLALGHAQRATALGDQLHRAPGLRANNWQTVGALQLQLGQFADAKASFEHGIALDQQGLPPDHPQLAEGRVGLAEALIGLGQPAAALPVLQLALPVVDAKNAGEGICASAHFLLGEATFALGDHAAAHEQVEQARAIYAAAKDLDPSDVRQRAEVDAWLAAHR